MAKVLGLRQQRVQFFYDTDFRTVGAVSSGADLAASEKILFAGATPGDLSRTNMPSPGQLTSDQTFLCFAVRHEIQFYPVLGVAAGMSGLSNAEELMIWTTGPGPPRQQASGRSPARQERRTAVGGPRQ